MFRQLRKTLDDKYKVIISRTQILDEYTEAFQKLADAENLPLDKARVRTVLSRYTADEIERAYDAAVRFGLTAMLNNM